MADQNNPNKPSERAVKDQIALLSFVEDIIKERQDPNIKPENITDVKELLLKELNDAINRHLIGLLTDRDQLELDDLLEKNVTDEQIDEFFAKKIPNLQSEIASVLLDFRNSYLYPVRDKLLHQIQSEPVSQNLQAPPPPQPAPINHESSDFPPMPAVTDKIN